MTVRVKVAAGTLGKTEPSTMWIRFHGFKRPTRSVFRKSPRTALAWEKLPPKW
jgi:hypothetical protein